MIFQFKYFLIVCRHKILQAYFAFACPSPGINYFVKEHLIPLIRECYRDIKIWVLSVFTATSMLFSNIHPSRLSRCRIYSTQPNIHTCLKLNIWSCLRGIKPWIHTETSHCNPSPHPLLESSHIFKLQFFSAIFQVRNLTLIIYNILTDSFKPNIHQSYFQNCLPIPLQETNLLNIVNVLSYSSFCLWLTVSKILIPKVT